VCPLHFLVGDALSVESVTLGIGTDDSAVPANVKGDHWATFNVDPIEIGVRWWFPDASWVQVPHGSIGSDSVDEVDLSAGDKDEALFDTREPLPSTANTVVLADLLASVDLASIIQGVN